MAQFYLDLGQPLDGRSKTYREVQGRPLGRSKGTDKSRKVYDTLSD